MADPPRPPRARSRTLDEAIERRRAQEEAERRAREAEREAARLHEGRESTEPPPPPPRPAAPPRRDVWPPLVRQGRPGEGSPSSAPPPQKRVEATHKAFVSVWGIIVILIGAAGGGWTARAFVGDAKAAEELRTLRDDVKELKFRVGMNQEQNQLTFGGLKTEIESIKKEVQAKQAEPLKPGGRR